MLRPGALKSCKLCGNEFPVTAKHPETTLCGRSCAAKWAARSQFGDAVDRFWRRVDRRGADECWVWTGSVNHRGYGQFFAGRHYSTHRFALIAVGRQIPSGAVVMHSCDNRPCCNPAHLSVGSHAENNADARAKGRASFGGAKLTTDQVRSIRASTEKSAVVAERFGISTSTVRRIRRGEGWSDIR